MTLAPKDYGLTRVALSSETNSVAVPPGTMTLAQHWFRPLSPDHQQSRGPDAASATRNLSSRESGLSDTRFRPFHVVCRWGCLVS